MWIRLGYEAPIHLAAERHWPTVWICNQIRLVAATSFEQQHPCFRIGRQSRRHDTSRSPCAAHDVVELLFQIQGHCILVYADSLREPFLLMLFHDGDAPVSLSPCSLKLGRL